MSTGAFVTEWKIRVDINFMFSNIRNIRRKEEKHKHNIDEQVKKNSVSYVRVCIMTYYL